MKFLFATLFAAFAAAYTTPTTQCTDSCNPISAPGLNQVVAANQPFTITWTPTTSGTVTIVLVKGPSTNVVPLYSIASDIQNSGTFTWTPSTDLEPTGDSGYGIQLINDADGTFQYSTQFGVSNPDYSSSSSAATTSTAASTKTSTNAASSTLSSTASQTAASTKSSTQSSTASHTSTPTSSHTTLSSSTTASKTSSSSTASPSQSNLFKSTTSSISSYVSSHKWVIIAAAVGGLVLLILLGVAIWACRKRSKSRQLGKYEKVIEPGTMMMPHPPRQAMFRD